MSQFYTYSLILKFIKSLQREGFLLTHAKVWRFIRQVIQKLVQPSQPKPSPVSLLQKLSRRRRIAKERALKQIGDLFNHEFYLESQCVVLARNGSDFAGHQVVLVAHWDPENIVDPYVKHLCRHFKEIGKKVVLCSSSYIHVENDSDHWVDAIVCRTCPGYDFTSWKAAMEVFPSLYLAEELTLCNDSVFAPVGSYAPVYATMKSVPCDFWGMVASNEIMPHLQSYHLVFNKKALSNKAVKQFFSSIPADLSRDKAIEFELRLGLWLELHGLQPGAFIPFFILYYGNPTAYLWKQILRWGCPIFKREHLNKAGTITNLGNWFSDLQKHGYPVNYILEYYYRVGRDISTVCCTGTRANSCPPNIMLQQKAINLPLEGKPLPTSLAVIVHCYYPDEFHSLLSYLKKMPTWAHIYLSTDTDAKAGVLTSELQQSGIANFEIRVFPNIGYDIAPFIVGFRDIILQFDLILKIHVKMSTYREPEFASLWKDLLYGSLVGDTQHINGILRLFESDHTLGVLAPPTFAAIPEVSQGENVKKLRSLLRFFDINIDYKDAIDFPVGSMFWARREALLPLLDIGLTFEDFEATAPKMRDGTLAHAVERSIFFSCYKAGLSWGRVPPAPWRVLYPTR